jgi:predicted transposase/invertase (TIGR01784 family)
MNTSLFEDLRLRAELRRLARENAEQGKPLNLTLDIVFKSLFGGNNEDSRQALRFLLSDCIHRPVAALSIRNNEIIPEHLAGKTVRLDVHVSFNDGEEADIEMQAGKSSDNLKTRALFYASRLLSGQEQKGKQYGEIKRIYQIFFLNSVLFPGSEKVPRRYTAREETEHDQLSPVMEILFYELPKLEKYVKEYRAGKGAIAPLSAEEKWCIYMRYKGNERLAGLIEELSQQEAGIMWAELALKKMNRDKEKWARALWREKRAMDYQDYQLEVKKVKKEAREAGLNEGREEGRAEGLNEGREKGLSEGREEGLSEGLAKGRKEALRETAKKFKDMGLPVDQIAAATGLDPGEIKKL